VQDQPDQDLPIAANLDVPSSIRSWITIDKGLNFIIPKGVHQFPVEFTVQIPADTPLGVYSGHLTFTGAPSQSGQVTIALGAQVAINLTVGNDIYRKINVPVVKLLDIEEGWDPRVYVKFSNEGNVAEHFDSATYELLDQYGSVRLAYSQNPNELPEVAPFTIKEFVVDFPINFHLGLGQYWGAVNFYQEGKVVGSQKTVFNVLKAGSLSSPSAQVLQFITKYWPYAAGAGGVLVLLLVIFIFRKRKRRKTRS
jgi:hypothetical protein